MVLVGLSVIAVGAAVLLADVPAWNTTWFLFAWTGWLIVVDSGIRRLQGHSFLFGRRRELGAMLFWSVPYWTLFEFYNLVLENWYYVFLPHSEVAQGLFAFCAFATVLPACFFHAELLRAAGLWTETRWRPLAVGPAVEAMVLGFGLACALLPLIWPRYTFPLVWGATLGIPELINRRVGAPSLLRDLEQGRPGRFLRLLGGGMIAGGVWESLNFVARAKWVYTVPFFEEWKLFEMPLLGFFGFPVLAVEAFAGYALICHLVRAGRHWEVPDAEQTGRPGNRHHALGLVLVVAFSWAADRLTLDPAVQARRPLLSELDELAAADVERLTHAGLSTPERLVRALEGTGLDGVSEATGVSSEALAAAAPTARLSLHKGMGTQAAARLIALGIDGPEALAAADAEALHGRLLSDGGPALRLAQVKVWVRAARLTGQLRR